MHEAESALRNYAQSIKGLPTSASFAIGEEDAIKVMRSRGIIQTPAELFAIASNFLNQTRSEIEDLRQRLTIKHGQDPALTAEGLQAFLIETFAVKVSGPIESVLDRYREEEERVLEFIDQTQLFPVRRPSHPHPKDPGLSRAHDPCRCDGIAACTAGRHQEKFGLPHFV